MYRIQEAKQPRFPLTICDRTFDLAQQHLRGTGFDGPVGLSCDDAALAQSPRLYWDPEQQKHFLVGLRDGPRLVEDVTSVAAALEGVTGANKVCNNRPNTYEYIANQ